MSEYRFVNILPDLIQPEDYVSDPSGLRLRLRIRVTEAGLEVLGDAMRPQVLETLLDQFDFDVIEQMLCG